MENTGDDRLQGICSSCRPKITSVANSETKKTPHEKLLDLGWYCIEDYGHAMVYGWDKDNESRLVVHKQAKWFYAKCRIDLELAKILVEYLEEL